MTVDSMKETERMVPCMDMEFTPEKMAEDMKEITSMTGNMAKESTFGPIKGNTMVTGSMENKMESVLLKI